MITFDKEAKELTFRQRDVQHLPNTLLRSLKDSYRKFMTETIKDDIQYLFDKYLSNNEEKWEVEIKLDLEKSYGRWSYTLEPFRFIPLTFRVSKVNINNGMRYEYRNQNFDYVLLELPQMDTMGRIITRNGVKAVVPSLRPIESASWDLNKQLYNIALPNANIGIELTGQGNSQAVRLKVGQGSIDLCRVVQGMLYTVGDNTSLLDVFISNTGKSICKLDPLTTATTYMNSEDLKLAFKKFDPDNTINGDMYNLGKATRDSLNRLYSMNNAKGETLSRDVVDAEGNVLIAKGTCLTDAHIRILNRNCINIVYVRDEQEVSVDDLEVANPICLTKIPKYCENVAFLQEKFPQYKDYRYLPEDIGSDDGPFVLTIWPGEKVTLTMLEFIRMITPNAVEFISTQTKKPVSLSFERTIVGNYMVRYGELVDSVTEKDRSYNEWVYTFNNPTFEKTDKKVLEHMTAHDFEAILADIIYIAANNGQSESLLNRDSAFLKKLSLVHDQFSKYLRLTFDNMFQNSSRAKDFMESIFSGKYMARTLTSNWIQSMSKDNVIQPYHVNNYLDELSMLTHANIKLRNVSDEIRHISMPYFGRICCVETPAGKPLGLNNNLAVNCKVVVNNAEDLKGKEPKYSDGTLLVPYYKITNKNGRPYLRQYDKNIVKDSSKDAGNIRWKSPIDELHMRVVSIQDLDIDSNGFITNETVLARIPNTNKSEPYIIIRVKTMDLIQESASDAELGTTIESYCTVTPEQILSTAACTIPFIGSDDATRVTYGLSQAKQAIYLKHTEEPIVRTSMYSEMLRLHEAEPICSDWTGKFEGFDGRSRGGFVVSGHQKSFADKDSFNGNVGLYRPPVPLVYEGDTVVKGEPVIQIREDPEPLNSYMPRKCIVNTINAESMRVVKEIKELWEQCPTVEYQDNLSDQDAYAFQNSRIVGESIAFTNLKNIWFRKGCEKNQLWKETTISRNGCYTPTRMSMIAYIPYGYNHEDGVVVTETAATKYTSMTVRHIDTPVEFGKHYRAYCTDPLYPRGDGDVLTYIYRAGMSVIEDRPVATVYATRESHGIPLETITISDPDKKSQKVRTFMISLDKLKEGDKMSGRHGNKGVVSKVIKDSDAPQFLNGMTPDVILNPHGVPSRMNIGQILEIHASFFGYLTGIKIKTDSFNGMTTAQVETSIHLVYDYSQWLKEGWINSAADLVSRIHATPEYNEFGLPVEFIEHMYENRGLVMDWIDCFNRDGSAQMYDPVTDTYYRTPITFGPAYYYKLEQQVNLKLKSRGGPLSEEYQQISQQPTETATSKKGQKLGEMELVALAAYGASGLLEEALNEKSDNNARSYNQHVKALGMKLPAVPENFEVPGSLETLVNYLNALNVKVDADQSLLPSIDFSDFKYTYDLQTAILATENPRVKSKETNTGDVEVIQSTTLDSQEILDAVKKSQGI